MTGDEIRAAYLDFFKEKEHRVIASSSLIPHGDPTLLLTSAGMVQFKPYFLGEEKPLARRLASVQKCFRTTDIESVGDSSHLTFFEMLGNFSIGDYFKEEAIAWAWEFVTGRLGIQSERLWVTIFLDDDEAFGIWRQTGVPAERILRFGREDNYWGPAGDSGPCGPSSEIHYDFGTEVGCRKANCAPNCACGRFSEIWNLVFVQYNQDKEGRCTALSEPGIDTGMGLERTTAVMQGKTSVYETDLFSPLIKHISRLTGNNYGHDSETDRAMRIVAEHSRGIAFLIADGVMPAAEGRGYVLRRLLRRAALFGRRLGLDEPFLAEMADLTIKQMGPVYPELIKRGDFVLELIGLEEARFDDTLVTGLVLLDTLVAKAASDVKCKVSGQEAFKLQDTYGFPVELTREIAAERGLAVDMEGFEREMARQRERARKSQKIEPMGIPSAEAFGIAKMTKATLFTGYDTLRQKTVVAGLLVDDKLVDAVKEGQQAGLIIEKTPFYAEMGGQVADTGEITGPDGRFPVEGVVQLPSGIIVHRGVVAGGSLAVGDEVEAVVDEARRLDIARNHTATHLLQSALRRVLGEHVQQRGSVVGPERLRFDFSHLKAMAADELRLVEQAVNEKVRQNLPVTSAEIAYKQAIDEGVTALFGEKYGENVRVLRIGKPPVSAELCGGTHIGVTGEIGLFQILGERSIGAGLRRIEAATGGGAEAHIIKEREDRLAEATARQEKAETKRAEAIELEQARGQVEQLLGRVETVDGVKLLASRVPPSRPETLRQMTDLLRERLGSVVIVLGTVYENKPLFLSAITADLVTRGFHAGKLVGKVSKQADGGGGGKPALAQGGGRDPASIDRALKEAKDYINQFGK
ncbi:MAG: alanine--tRNA ligase [Dehalococcoidales bacterium]